MLWQADMKQVSIIIASVLQLWPIRC